MELLSLLILLCGIGLMLFGGILSVVRAFSLRQRGRGNSGGFCYTG